MMIMMEIKERDIVQEENGRQFLVISVTSLGGTKVVDLLSAEEGILFTIFSPPRQFRKASRLRFGPYGDTGKSNFADLKYDTTELLKPFLAFNGFSSKI
jgi:hypothetical protein